MKYLILTFFLNLSVFSSFDDCINCYKQILTDIKSSNVFQDFIMENEACSNLEIEGSLRPFCNEGELFVFDYPDISDYISQNCCDQKSELVSREYKELTTLSDKGKPCFKVYFTEQLNNKVVIRLVLENSRTNEELYYLFEVHPDKTVSKLNEMVLIVE